MDKCLFVITGDTFRLGGQRSPNKGGEESYNRQRLATDSHNRFFKNIEEKFNVKCDLFLNIYKCDDEYDSAIFIQKEWRGRWNLHMIQ